MKKLFTLAAAVLASFSLWAAEPDFESYDWQSQAAAEAVAGDHDGIVISYAGLGNPGNVNGHWYIPNNQNLKNSDSDWKYFGIAATSKIDSIAVLYCANGSTTSLTNIAWVAWGEGETPNQYTLAHGMTTGLVSKTKSWDDAVWETIDLTDVEDAYTVYLSRSVREFREIGASSNLPNFGGGQTFNILGLRVWLASGTPAPTYTVTYKANNGTEEADVVAENAKKVAACTFTAPEGEKFVGWNTAADGNGDDYAVGDKVESDLTLYAQWETVCYKVIYDLVGGIGSAEVTAADATVSVEPLALIMSNTAGRITLTPLAGYEFKAGDIIEFSGTVGNASRPFGIKVGSDTYEAAEVIPNDPEEATAGGTASYAGVLKADGATLVMGRDGGTTTTLLTCVIKREVECEPTAIDNTNATVKATKRLVNGQLFIEKNGVMYNAQGAVVC